MSVPRVAEGIVVGVCVWASTVCRLARRGLRHAVVLEEGFPAAGRAHRARRPRSEICVGRVRNV